MLQVVPFSSDGQGCLPESIFYLIVKRIFEVFAVR